MTRRTLRQCLHCKSEYASASISPAIRTSAFSLIALYHSLPKESPTNEVIQERTEHVIETCTSQRYLVPLLLLLESTGFYFDIAPKFSRWLPILQHVEC